MAEARKRPYDQVEPLAQGRVWLGTQAKMNGLVDEIGGLDRAVEMIKQRTNIPASEQVTLVTYPPRRTLLELLLKSSNDNSELESAIHAVVGTSALEIASPWRRPAADAVFAGREVTVGTGIAPFTGLIECGSMIVLPGRPSGSKTPFHGDRDNHGMSFTVFLGNLPTWVTADDIKGWLTAENLVADAIKVIRNPETQESKGFAFIEAPNTEEMNSIIRRFDRAPLEDRLLRANPAQPARPKGQAQAAVLRVVLARACHGALARRPSHAHGAESGHQRTAGQPCRRA